MSRSIVERVKDRLRGVVANGEAKENLVSVAPADPFSPLNQVLEKHFYKPDLQAVRIVLGTAKTHYLNIGDPSWLFAVGPPGTGKTVMLVMAATQLPQVVTLGDLTENTFLSGMYGQKDPGLLEQLGKTKRNGVQTTQGDGLFLIKDFTTVLSMKRDKRAVILSQLREIHDGEFKKAFGTGETKIWRGRISIIAAVTPALDRHYSIFSTLGERFLQVRWHRPDSPEAGQWAIEQQGQEKQIREELRAEVGRIFDASSTTAPALSQEMSLRIANLAEIVAIGRTHVYRSSYGNREIEYVPEPEANTRIAKGLAGIAKGIGAVNGRNEVAEQDLQDVFRVGLDCIPEVRRQVLVDAMREERVILAKAPNTTKKRAQEELVELGILDGPQDLSYNANQLFEAAQVKGEES